MTVDLSVTLVNQTTDRREVTLPCCVYNASGPRSGTAEALRKVAESSAGAVLCKSATLEAQTGNPLPRTHHHASTTSSSESFMSFNSEGLPNKGIDYYIAEETIDTAMGENPLSKPYFVSLSGKTMADNITMIRKIGDTPHLAKIASIELNLACPNVIGKPIIGYDVAQVKEALRQVHRVYSEKRRSTPLPPLGIKLPPYLDTVLLKNVASVIASYQECIAYVVCINTVGNTLPIHADHDMPQIHPNNGLAGMSGAALKPIALANIRQFHQLLPASCSIVGVGGVQTGHDVYDMLLAGATAVQVGTTHWKEGASCFDRIVKELQAVLQAKGHARAAAVTGTLQPWTPQARTKKQKANKKETSLDDDQQQQYKILSIVLIVVVGILLADKFGETFL